MSAESGALLGHNGAGCGEWLLTSMQELAGKKHRGLHLHFAFGYPATDMSRFALRYST